MKYDYKSWVWLKRKEQESHEVKINGLFFTSREADVIACYISGHSRKHSAKLLSLSPHTIQTHTRNIIRKIQCHSREGIVSFVEQSDFHDTLRNHYFNLLRDFDLKILMKNLRPRLIQKKCLLKLNFYGDEIKNYKKPIEIFLEDLGVEKNVKVFKEIPKETSFNDRSIHFLSRDLISSKYQEKHIGENDLKSILLLTGDNNLLQEKSLEGLKDIPKKSYELAILDILKQVLEDEKITVLIDAFKDKWKQSRPSNDFSNTKLADSTKPNQLLEEKFWSLIKKKPPILLVLFIIIGALFIGYKIYYEDKSYISNIQLISKNKLLIREKLLDKIRTVFDNNKKSDQNSIIGIIGIGGSGKTTLAKQYAPQNKAPLVWELDAQSIESLERSFELIASAIGNINENLQQSYKKIVSQFNGKEKNLKLIEFVKKYLKSTPGWILIYDDLRISYGSVQDYLFIDPRSVGRGQIIITSRDGNIKFSIGKENVIDMPFLSDNEKRQLFFKITSQDLRENKDIKDLLAKIPPFPLDVSVASYYIEKGLLDVNAYLERLENPEDHVIKAQKNILNLIGKYTNTRQSIMSMAIQKIIDTRKEFKEILFFLALSNSKNIPLPLLEKYYGNIVVDEFMDALTKHSFITDISIENRVRVFSIHDSVHESLLVHVKNLYSKSMRETFGSHIVSMLRKILGMRRSEIREFELLHLIRHILQHCETLLTHSNFFKNNDFILLKVVTYFGHSYFADCHKKKQHLLESISFVEKMGDVTLLSDLYSYLGDLHRSLGEQQKGNEYTLKSLDIIAKNNPKDFKRICLSFHTLADDARKNNHYKKAFDFIERAEVLYKKFNNIEGIVRSKGTRCMFYADLCLLDKAEKEAREALAMLKDFPKNSYIVNWIKTRIAHILTFRGEYEEAFKLIKDSYSGYKEFYDESHVKGSLVSVLLGLNYGFSGQYKKAYEYLGEAYKKKKIYPGETSFDFAIVVQALGIVNFLEGNFEKAREYLKQSIFIFPPNHPKSKISLEYLRKIN